MPDDVHVLNHDKAPRNYYWVPARATWSAAQKKWYQGDDFICAKCSQRIDMGHKYTTGDKGRVHTTCPPK